MERLLGSVFGLRRRERTLAFLMAGYHFLLLVSLYFLKPVRDSVFLSSRGPDELPFVFLLTTVVVLPVTILHARAGRRTDVGPLIDGVSLLLVGSLVGLRVLMGMSGEWMAYLLYAWVSIYGLLVTSQFWLLANALFSASQSKRIFPLLSGGAILGAIVGGEVTGLLVTQIGLSSESMLWAAAAVLLGATGLGWGIRHLARRQMDQEASSSEEEPDLREASGAFSIIGESRHIQLIVAILTLMVVVSTLVDYQFKTVAAQAYPTEEALTTFMGRFYGRVSIIALIVQFVVAPRLMRMVGIGGALSVLPGMLAVGTVGMLVVPGLVAGVFLRGSGQSLKHSIDKTGRELLFVPVSLKKKKRVKVFVDLFVDQGAQGLGGLLLLGLAYGAGVSVQMLSIVTFALIVMWAVLTYEVRQSYVHQFRAKLQAQTPDDESEQADLDDTDYAPDFDDLIDDLCSHVETDVLHALEKLEAGAGPVPVDALLCLLDHPSATVRAEALRILRIREVPDVGEDVAASLRDPDPDVQVEAARYLYCQLTDNHLERLQQALDHEDPQIQSAAVGLIAEEGGLEEYRLVPESLLRRLVETDGARGREARIQVARILGVLDRSYRKELLHRLLRDDEPAVVRAALRAAGQTGDRSFVYPLVRALEDETLEGAAREALSSFGGVILGTLHDLLIDDTVSLAVRRRLPSLFALRPSRFGLTLLVRSLRRVPIPVRSAVVRALSKVHRAGHFTIDADAVDEAIEREIEHYAALGQILRLHLETSRGDGAPLAPAPLQTLREETLERIFRLLGLRYDHSDIYHAYHGITSRDSSLRDSAVEFIDNLVDYSTRRVLLPLLDDPEAEQAVQTGRQYFDLQINDQQAAREYLDMIEDPRLDRSRPWTDGALEEVGTGRGFPQSTPWVSSTNE
jgi:ATP/ADP translocase